MWGRGQERGRTGSVCSGGGWGVGEVVSNPECKKILFLCGWKNIQKCHENIEEKICCSVSRQDFIGQSLAAHPQKIA